MRKLLLLPLAVVLMAASLGCGSSLQKRPEDIGIGQPVEGGKLPTDAPSSGTR